MLVISLLISGVRVAYASQRGSGDANTLHENIPLGIQGFFVRPARKNLYIMSTAQSPYFEGWRLVGNESSRTILGPDGYRVRYYPRHIHFRVTATANIQQLLQVERDFLDIDADLNSFLLRLGFRLKIFHGLAATTIQPDSIEMIGAPSNVNYDERIYRANFNLPKVPIEDRIVLEILSPAGERMCKFHLGF